MSHSKKDYYRLVHEENSDKVIDGLQLELSKENQQNKVSLPVILKSKVSLLK